LLLLTLAENCIWTESGFENRNEANLAGLRLERVQQLSPLQPGQAHGLFGDTLKVVLDVSAASVSGGAEGLRYLVSATHRCMLLNAALELPRFHFVDIAIRGSDALEEFEGVFPIGESAGEGEVPNKRLQRPSAVAED
jgi:hypothetical protein